MENVQARIKAIYDRVEQQLKDGAVSNLPPDQQRRQLKSARRFVEQVWPKLPSILVLSELDLDDLRPVEALGNETSVWLDSQRVDGAWIYKSGAHSFYSSRTWNIDGPGSPDSEGIIIRCAKDGGWFRNGVDCPSFFNPPRGSGGIASGAPMVSFNSELMRIVRNGRPPTGGSLAPHWYVYAWFTGSAEEKCERLFVVSGSALYAAVRELLNSVGYNARTALQFFEKLLRNSEQSTTKYLAQKRDYNELDKSLSSSYGVSIHSQQENGSGGTTYLLCISFAKLSKLLKDDALLSEIGEWRALSVDPFTSATMSLSSGRLVVLPTRPRFGLRRVQLKPAQKVG